MKNIYILLLMLACANVANAADTLDVAPGATTLIDAIKEHKGSKVYRLQDGYNGYYVLSEIAVCEDFSLNIVGGGTPEAGDPKPDMPPTVQLGSIDGAPLTFMFHIFQNITLKDIYFVNATTAGVLSQQYLLNIAGNGSRVIIDNCIFDPSGNPFLCHGANVKLYVTNSLFNALTTQTTSVNGPVNNYFNYGKDNQLGGLDTLLFENNTFVGISTAFNSDGISNSLTKFTWINHNTFMHHKAQLDWMVNQKEFYFTNNLLYDCHVIPYVNEWVGGWDNYPSKSFSELLWQAPSDKVWSDGGQIDFGTDQMTSFVCNNLEFKNQQFIDNLDSINAWLESVGGAGDSIYFMPLVWTDEAPDEARSGIDKAYAMSVNPHSSLYNSTPTWKANGNIYDVNPAMNDSRIDSLSEIFAEWVLPAFKKDYYSSYYSGGTEFQSLYWYWDPDGDLGKNETWPVFSAAYSSQEIKTHGIDGLPLGDLNWFPAEKNTFEDNVELIKTHILALNTEQLELEPSTAVKSPSIIYKALKVYPNPNSGEISIADNYDILSIYSISGKLVKQFNHYHQKADISDLAKGMYILQLHLDDELVGHAKIIKE